MKRIATAGFALLATACVVATTTRTEAPPVTDVTSASAQTDLPEGVTWGPAPPFLPPGSRAAILTGDPSQPQVFVVRVWYPANYTLPPHWHPTSEHVTVLRGTLHIGMGETMNIAGAQTLRAGSFIAVPANMRHFLHTVTESVIEIQMMGPFEIHYVNPADDPRRR